MTRTSATISRSTSEHGMRNAAVRSGIRCESPAVDTLAAAATCPTCLAAPQGILDPLPGATHPGVRPAACPTCGVTSIEFGLVVAIDDVLGEMVGLDRLAAALDEHIRPGG
ncbi:MAG: hypothetical protein M9891_01310 [Austwickia sp.]|nr:hypothetical protein [Actinomycetota bacterium]MCB1254029.1 hypothetical protein [Austwickia sp.]MCO5307930.1 hypothetical protein [Austwickia sp.]